MSIWSDPFVLLPGLKPAAYRGIVFHVPDISHSFGRRALLTYFPGIDGPAADDLGQQDGRITVRGLILGDDYAARALALQAALQIAGPGTLLHPWLGEMSVIVPEDGAQISFSGGELRVARIDVTFLRVRAASLFGGSTLATLLTCCAALVSAASLFGARALSRTTLAVSTWSAAVSTAGAIGTVVSAACSASAAAAALEPAIEPTQAALSAATDAAAGADGAVTISAAIVDLTRPVAAAAIGSPRPAIAAGGDASDPVAALSAAAGASLLLSVVAGMRAVDAIGAPASALRLAAQLAAIADAVRTAAEVDFESRQDAMAWRDALDAVLDAAADDAATVALDLPAEVAGLWGVIADLRAALFRDLDEVIGRLPAVRLLTPATTVSAWLIANHLVGDDPTTVAAMLDDIVTRNQLRHAGAVPPDEIEVLL